MGSWWEPHSCARARPDFGSHDSPIYRQSQERAEAAGRDDAVRIYWPYLDYRGGDHGIIMYAAQIYGFYHEIDHLIGNLDAFSKQLSAHPSNALAVALSSNRNKIYREIILNSVDICNDVRQVCLSDTKMTEKERMEVIFGIRPKLKLMNKKLQRLTKAVKYTSLGDVWAEIDYHARTGADKKNIVEESMLRWKRAAKR